MEEQYDECEKQQWWSLGERGNFKEGQEPTILQELVSVKTRNRFSSIELLKMKRESGHQSILRFLICKLLFVFPF